MPNSILPKHNNTAGVVPTPDSLITNEFAINTADAVAYVKHSDGTIKQIIDPTKVSKDSDTGAALIPSGTTAQRPVGGQSKLRFNTDIGRFEGHNGNDWGLLGGALGGGKNAIFYTNDQTVTEDFTINAGQNALSIGPVISFVSSAVVTVEDNAIWTII
jgi:hypothetical protein